MKAYCPKPAERQVLTKNQFLIMETTIKKTVKGATMEALFNSCELFSVKYFENLTLKDNEEFNPAKNYRYKILLRHPENTDANVLFEEARFQQEIVKADEVATHTAGQWSVSKTVNDFAIYSDTNDSKDIAAVYQNSRSIPQGEAEANAKLIAAAPLLLEAAIKMQNHLNYPNDKEFFGALDNLNSAIKAATL